MRTLVTKYPMSEAVTALVTLKKEYTGLYAMLDIKSAQSEKEKIIQKRYFLYLNNMGRKLND